MRNVRIVAKFEATMSKLTIVLTDERIIAVVFDMFLKEIQELLLFIELVFSVVIQMLRLLVEFVLMSKSRQSEIWMEKLRAFFKTCVSENAAK